MQDVAIIGVGQSVFSRKCGVSVRELCFEAYTEAVVSPLGLKVHWIDTWYYHVRFGELHCGTNTIRRPNLKAKKPWWSIQTNN